MILEYPIKEINGTQLAKELNIDLHSVWVDEKTIFINTDKSAADVKKILDNHIPKNIDYSVLRASALAKLAALGLTEDEIAAL